jgi:hypothetical protein
MNKSVIWSGTRNTEIISVLEWVYDLMREDSLLREQYGKWKSGPI